MNQLALVANCRSAWPSRWEIDNLGVTGIRTIVYHDDDLEAALEDTPPHVRIVAMLNNEHEAVGWDWSGWNRAVAEFAGRFEGRVHAVECGNELDLWGLPASHAADLVRMAHKPLSDHGILTIMGGVAGSDWPEWLARACGLSQGSYDAVALHPYGQRPDGFANSSWGFGLLGDAIEAAYDAADAPVYLTEWGVKIGDAGGEEGQAEYLRQGIRTIRGFSTRDVPFAAYFCWADIVGGPHERDAFNAFGLRDMRMRPRPSWHAFRDESRAESPPIPAPEEPPPVPDENRVYTLDDVRKIRWQAIVPAEYHADWGFEQYAAAHPEVGSPLTVNELTLDTGEQCRPFCNAILVWRGDHVEEVR